MNLKCIFEVEKDKELEERYRNIYASLKSRMPTVGEYNQFEKSAIFEDYSNKSSYARNTHTGKIKAGIEIDELELSMICDDGFSHFGGSSSIDKDGNFTVVIYTD